jgi:Tfp pilus assembly protein FimT
MLEVLVTVALIAVMGALALPNLNQSAMNLPTTTQTLVGDLRMTRANATSRGARYRVTLASDSYSIQRLQDDDGDGVWEPDSAWPAENVDLPRWISLSVNEGDGVIEFNTRGLVEPPNAEDPPEVEKITLSDSRDEGTKKVEVYPSGQVLEV